MDTQNTSVRPHAQPRNGGQNHPSRGTRAPNRSGGVIHDNSRHTSRFTVIGNHLAQHAELSLLAIGLAVHIQGRAVEDVLAVLAERGIDVPEAVRERITGCGDAETLGRWLRRAVTAPSADAIFGGG
ncbi:hypothetical protein [Streptomyces virginiae]|uniref:hypothetical protein n=1 Tax=Streptomyces virginiae TaxID=1961 RepID=UPI003F53EB2F